MSHDAQLAGERCNCKEDVLEECRRGVFLWITVLDCPVDVLLESAQRISKPVVSLVIFYFVVLNLLLSGFQSVLNMVRTLCFLFIGSIYGPFDVWRHDTITSSFSSSWVWTSLVMNSFFVRRARV